MEEVIESISEERMLFAVLIDADNISSKYVVTIFEELEKYGLSTYRRIYGNWSKANGCFWSIPSCPCSNFPTHPERMPRIWPWP